MSTAVTTNNTNAKDRRSFAVYRSDAEGSRGDLISNAHSRQWNKVAKKWAFKGGLPQEASDTWVRVELKTPGRGQNPARAYHLNREWVTPTANYIKQAQSRNYKNIDVMSKVTIVDKPLVLISNKRKSRAKASDTVEKRTSAPEADEVVDATEKKVRDRSKSPVVKSKKTSRKTAQKKTSKSKKTNAAAKPKKATAPRKPRAKKTAEPTPMEIDEPTSAPTAEE